MLRNYLKVAIRNLLKYKLFSFINLFGLALALSVCMLLLLMLGEQRSYDRWNPQGDRIYRILSDRPDFRHGYATSPAPLAGALLSQEPGVEAVTQLRPWAGGDAHYGERTVEMRGYFADSAFFSVFPYALEKGDKGLALEEPNSMVLSAEMAGQLFPGENPIGKVVRFTDRGLRIPEGPEASEATDWGLFRVTGVLAGQGHASHLRFDMLVSASSIKGLSQQGHLPDINGDWQNIYSCYTYALLRPSVPHAVLDSALGRLAVLEYAGRSEWKGARLLAQPLFSISPGILLGNECGYFLPKIVYYFLGVLALVILVSAGLNYVGLSVARALTRAREIGVRKVNGALRGDLVVQFLFESVLLALLALVMALLLLWAIRAGFLGMWVNQYLHLELGGSWAVYGGFGVLTLVVGLLAGLYPALYLSKAQPVKTLRGAFAEERPGKLGWRKVISVLQLSVSLIFIISSILVFKQAEYFLRFHYEFNPQHVVNISLQSNSYPLVSRELSVVPGVVGVAGCDYVPNSGRSEGGTVRRMGDSGEYKSVQVLRADANFLSNLELRMVAGQNFPAGDVSGKKILLNETAVREFGYSSPMAAVGQHFQLQGNDTTVWEVAGIVQDFHLGLDQVRIPPLIVHNVPGLFHYAMVKVEAAGLAATMARMEKVWKKIDPVHPFRYRYYDEQLKESTIGFFDAVSTLSFMAVLAVTIALLGMLGMATYTTERRRKEVGIRKVMGAGERSIVLLLSKGFVRMLLIAVLIAAPIAFMLNMSWLRSWPNRVAFGWVDLLIGSLFLVVPGLLTIGSQTFFAARRKPVEVLRAE